MNNIFVNNDPLLNPQPIQYSPQYMMDPNMISPVRDWLGELDRTLKNLDQSVIEQLNTNEYKNIM